MIAESQTFTAAQVEAKLADLKQQIVRALRKKGLGYSALLIIGMDFAAIVGLHDPVPIEPVKPRPVFGEK